MNYWIKFMIWLVYKLKAQNQSHVVHIYHDNDLFHDLVYFAVTRQYQLMIQIFYGSEES